jgi:bacteriocin biosynthesis cyclodehydratase domain-containing protein
MFSNGGTVAVMEGAAVSRYVAPVAALLDGQRTTEEIARLADLEVERVEQVIGKLTAAKVVVEGSDVSTASPAFDAAAVTATCWPQLGQVSDAVSRVLAAHVGIVGSDAVTRLVAQQLLAMGVNCSLYATQASDAGTLPHGALNDDLVVIGPSAVPALAREVNRTLYEANVPWLPISPFNGRWLEVGPLIVPPDSGCFECHALRRQANVSYSAEVYDSVERSGAASTLRFPPLEHAAAATAAFLVHEWLAVRHPELPGRSFIERAGSWEREVHQLLRVPRCPVCSGEPERGIPAAWWSTT